MTTDRLTAGGRGSCLTLRLLAQVPLPKVASVHYHGLFAGGAKQRAEVVPALCGRVAHNKRKGKPKAGAKVGAATDPSRSKPPGDGGEPFKLVGAAAMAYAEIEIEKEYSTKLTWAQCLRRAFAVAERYPILLAPEASHSDVEPLLGHARNAMAWIARIIAEWPSEP